tara:strand:+ start:1472 stop:1654 length:183 start_codon:yes stop_codon:yes gene_type:complete
MITGEGYVNLYYKHDSIYNKSKPINTELQNIKKEYESKLETKIENNTIINQYFKEEFSDK